MLSNESVVGTKKILEAVKAFRQLRDVELGKKEKSSILDQNDRNERFVHLQLTVKKMSASQKITMVPFTFPHCLVQEDDEVCFIVGCKDGDKGNKRADHERYANEYKQKLRKLGIDREIHILPIMQLETEFRSFEAKRKLCHAFDHFICDHRILFRMPQLLGTSFYRRRKLPIRVYMKNENDLKEIINDAIQKTLIYITPEGPNVSLKVGNLQDHTDEQIAENIRSVLDNFIPESLPGGVSNLNSIHLASFLGRSVPLFVSLASANNVDMSETDKKFVEKQTPKELEDTIDTMPGVRVKVRSDGKVVAIKDDSENMGVDELLDEDYLDVFREQEFEERDEAKKRHVKHMARKATLRKVGKRFGSNMLKLPSSVPRTPKPNGAQLPKKPKLPKQKVKTVAASVVMDALQGFDEETHDPSEEQCPQLIPIVKKKAAKRQTKSLVPQNELPSSIKSGVKAQKARVKRTSTTGFIEDLIAETPRKKSTKKDPKSDFFVEFSPKQKSPKSNLRMGMTVTKIDTPPPTQQSRVKQVDTPRPILKTPRKTPGKEKRKSVTFDFTPDSDVDPRKTATATATPVSGTKLRKRKRSTGVFSVTPMSVKKQKKSLKISE